MILKRLKIETMIGNYTNCYIIVDEEMKEAMIIDPAGEPEKILETINLLGTNVKYIYLTHCHADHTAGVEEIKNITNCKVLIHRNDYENLKNPEVTLSELIGINNLHVEADARVDEGDKLHIR
ncbi:MAG: MBL fold metallo-hydrolase [Clostridia bacterium]|jgi:hydroxyacylglutathione hydrolase|nr:MBL fold metallo-hydrolase [Clostridia bacterium]